MLDRRPSCHLILAAASFFVLGACATSPYRTSRHGRPDGPPRDDRPRVEREERGPRPDHAELSQLARELDSRASRADQIAEPRSAEPGRGEHDLFGRLRSFSSGARHFRAELESGALTGGRLEGALARLLDQARETDRLFEGANVSRRMHEEWQGIERILERMRALVQG